MFYSVCTIISKTLSLFAIMANLVLLPLIWYRSTRELGAYRYLLLSYTIIGLLFSLVIIIGAPVFGPSEQGWILYASSANLPKEQGWWIIVLYCFCYVAELLTLAVSFVYRYFNVCRLNGLIWFRKGWRLVLLVFLLSLVAFVWTGLTVVYLSPNEELNDVFAMSVYSNTRMAITNVSYIAGLAFKDGHLVWGFFGIFCFRLLVIMGSLITVIVCSSRIALCLKYVNFGDTQKRRTIKTQRRLFYLLMLQTIVPIVLIYVPAVSSYIIAFFRFEAPNLTMFYTILMPLAQFIDPLMIIVLVRDYRHSTVAIGRRIANVLNRRMHKRVSDCQNMRF